MSKFFFIATIFFTGLSFTHTQAQNTIEVLSASYGQNCSYPGGDVTPYLKQNCNSRIFCEYLIDSNYLGDPVRGCDKDFRVKWICGKDQKVRQALVYGEASGKNLYLDCLPPMEIVRAIYGANCRNNKIVTSSVAQTCNGRGYCNYDISSRRLGDPARGCDKDFRVYWRCEGDTQSHEEIVPGEASGKNVFLRCE